tara:strand:+ start:2740 stop:2883 length:144 start_codon:yes stop_codon:yes gene_type:complete
MMRLAEASKIFGPVIRGVLIQMCDSQTSFELEAANSAALKGKIFVQH